MDSQAILNGRKPSAVFNEHLAANPNSDKHEIARAFADAFPDVDSVSSQVIWSWGRPGMADEKLDLILTDLLQKARYLVKAE